MPTPAEQLALSIVQRLQAAGHVAYFAGGCVRDRLMNREPKDFDVATSATPDQVLAIFPRSQQVGAAFGVILVRDKRGGAAAIPPPAQVEVATFRADAAYSDGRHPDSVRFTNAEEDAKRRDFTCNGLFFDPLANRGTGQLHDFVGGQQDIAARILRAIGEPEARFGEDHLRLLRAVRFAARLDFAIEPATRAAIEKLAPNITSISRERIGEEMRMILAHSSRARAVRLLEATGLMQHIWPDYSPISVVLAATTRRIDLLPEKSLRALALAALYRDYAPPVTNSTAHTGSQNIVGSAQRLQQAFALSNQERDDFAWLNESLSILLDPAQRTRAIYKRLLADVRFEMLQLLFLVERGEAANADLGQWIDQLRGEPGGVAPSPYITGETLISLGVQPNPKFRQWLSELYSRQLENEFLTQEAALAATRLLISTGK